MAEIKDLIDQAERIGTKLIVISGGEPLLRRDILEILRHGTAPKLLLTNGSLLTTGLVQEMNEIPCLKELKLSFDGIVGHDTARGAGNSAVIRKGLEILNRYSKIPYVIDTVVSEANYAELLNIYEAVAASRAYRWEIDFPLLRGRALAASGEVRDKRDLYRNFIVPLIRRYIEDGQPFKMNILGALRWELFERLREFQTYEPKANPCEYAVDSITIQTSGSVCFCPSLRTVFGNSKSMSLSDILQSEAYQSFIGITLDSMEPCSHCRYRQVCGGGCRADALAIHGNIRGCDPRTCERMLLFEEFVLDELPSEVSSTIRSLLVEDGYIPSPDLQTAMAGLGGQQLLVLNN